MASDGENNSPPPGEEATQPGLPPTEAQVPQTETVAGLPIAINSRQINPEDQLPGGDLHQPTAARTNYILIQFRELPDDNQERELDALHVQFCRKIPPTTWLARYEPQDLAPIQNLPFVVYVNPYHPSLSLRPAFENQLRSQPAPGIRVHGLAGEASASAPPAERYRVSIMLHPLSRGPREIREELVSSYGIPREDIFVDITSLRALLTAEQILRVSEIDDVSGVHPTPGLRLANHLIGETIGTLQAGAYFMAAHHGLDLDGRIQIICVTDTGLDNGEAYDVETTHPFFGGRILWMVSRTDARVQENDCSDNVGHGTHVAGIACGSYRHMGRSRAMELEGPWLQGVAPGAYLFVQSITGDVVKDASGKVISAGETHMWDHDMECHRIFLDPYWAYPAPENIIDPTTPHGFPTYRGGSQLPLPPGVGARIFNWSFGTDVEDTSGYEPDGLYIDETVHHVQDALIVISAGNDGDNSKVLAHHKISQIVGYAAAKNGLTVGACYNNQWTKTSALDDELDPSLYETFEDSRLHAKRIPATNVARFSSRGPPTDGPNDQTAAPVPKGAQPRIKPDVVAPGVVIYSSRSRREVPLPPDYEKDPWGAPPAPDPSMKDGVKLCTFMSGTSMAAPVVSGAAALLRQALARRGREYANPSAALLKALIVHGAVDLNTLGGQLYKGNSIGGGGSGLFTVTQRLLPAPSDAQGWGRLNIGSSVRTVLDTKLSAIWDARKTPTSDSRLNTDFRDNVPHAVPIAPPPGPPMGAEWDAYDPDAEDRRRKPPTHANIKATLAWTDLPGFYLQNQLLLSIEFDKDKDPDLAKRNVTARGKRMEWNNLQKLQVTNIDCRGKEVSAKVRVTAKNIVKDPVEGRKIPQAYALCWTVWYT